MQPKGTRMIWLDLVLSPMNELLLKLQTLAPLLSIVSFLTNPNKVILIHIALFRPHTMRLV